MVVDGLVKGTICKGIYGIKLAGLKVESSTDGHQYVECSPSEGGSVYIKVVIWLPIPLDV